MQALLLLSNRNVLGLCVVTGSGYMLTEPTGWSIDNMDKEGIQNK